MVELLYKNYVLNILDDVYYPSDDTYLLLDTFKEEIINKHFNRSLEIGTGNGLLSLEIYDFCDDVIVVDVNPNVIKYMFDTKKRYLLNKLTIINSNLFDKVNDKFDLIIFNPPYVPSDKIIDLAVDGGKDGSKIINQFIEQLYYYLTDNGVCYLLISSLNKKNNIFKKIRENNLNFEILNSKRIFFEELIVLKINK
jgi:release factor glutamine methyltransferase